MKNIKKVYFILGTFITISLTIKLIMIFKYGNELTLASDDLNYIESAVYLLKKNALVFHNYNEPTVFIMPGYPLFLAMIFRIFGYAIAGYQMVRVIQAIISCITILMVFKISVILFDMKVALLSAFLTSFYIPNIITSGYLLTETLFTALLYILLYYSLVYSDSPSMGKFAALGAMWAAAVMLRPTIAPYPGLLFFYMFVNKRNKFKNLIKYGLVMAISFIVIFLPWWLRNYNEYGKFIPLAASSGNPMLQGTYVNYYQTPENVVYYKLGRNALETNETEVKVAKMRIKEEFQKDFWGYLNWLTLGKTRFFWGTVFYWRELFGIPIKYVTIFHYFLLTGFAGIILCMFNKFKYSKYVLPVSLIFLFNIVHCVYMAFDRYAFPLMPLLTIFCAYFVKSSVVLIVRITRTASIQK